MDFFHYNCKPILFATYFLPFFDIDNNEEKRGYPCDEEGYIRKKKNIEKQCYGNYNNYASQGIPKGVFVCDEISFEYFYSRLCYYDKEKMRWFDKIVDLESETTKNDLRKVLDFDELMLKRNKYVHQTVKQELLEDIDNEEVKVVLAKILYYIVSESHVLPNVKKDKLNRVLSDLEFQIKVLPNVQMNFRRNIDEPVDILEKRLNGAKSIQMCLFDGVSLFGDSDIVKGSTASFYSVLKGILSSNEHFQTDIILSKLDSEMLDNASRFQINVNHLKCSKKELSRKIIEKLKSLKNEVLNDNLTIKITEQSLPYALFIVCFNDEKRDYMKIDLYSPFVSENKDRPSFYIFRYTNPILFNHFVTTFENMWRNDDYSRFV